MDSMRENKGKVANLSDISPDLLDLGFTNDEITRAYGWFTDRLSAGSNLFDGFSRLQSSQRILSAQERLQVDIEAHGFLLNLMNFGIIDPLQFEMILDKAFVYGTRPVTLDQMKWLASGVVFDEFSSDDGDSDLDDPLSSGSSARVN